LKAKRKYLEVKTETAKKIDIICIILDKNKKQFISDLMEEGLRPYEHWIENMKMPKNYE